jgi:hypothetical protein
MKKILLIILVFILRVAVADNHPAAKGEEALKQATDVFMTKISEKQTAQAVGDLLDRYWYDRSDLDKTKAKSKASIDPEMAKMEINVGKPLPKMYEFLGVRRIGKSIVRFVYLLKHENYVSPWSFTFYKAKGEFQLVAISFGDDVTEDVKAFTITEPGR